MNSSTRNLRTALKQGVFWGIGHTSALFLIGLSIFIFGIHLPAAISIWAEKTVAIILIFYGLRIFQRFFYSRKTYNGAVIHDHPPLGLHLHKNPSFWIGALHGLAGSAAILILIISVFQSALLGLIYILIFGLGSITGMFLFSLGIGALQMRYEKYTGFAAGIFSCITALFLLFS